MGKGGGAGRKTQTSTFSSNDNANNRGAGPGRFMAIPADRDLREELGGVIFGATADTIRGPHLGHARLPLGLSCAPGTQSLGEFF